MRQFYILIIRNRFSRSALQLTASIILLLASSFTQGQSLSLVNYDSLVVGDANQSLAIFAHAAIKNNADYPIDLMVKRIDGNYTALTDSNAICWGICYHPDVSVSTMVISVGPGETDSLNFTGHVYPDRDGVPAVGEITYVFFDENNPADSLSMTVEYQVTVTTSTEEKLVGNGIKLYPNPAVDFINIEFASHLQESGWFILYDISGKLMHRERMNALAKTYKSDLSGLESGQYFYQLLMNSSIIKSGKLILNK